MVDWGGGGRVGREGVATNLPFLNPPFYYKSWRFIDNLKLTYIPLTVQATLNMHIFMPVNCILSSLQIVNADIDAIAIEHANAKLLVSPVHHFAMQGIPALTTIKLQHTRLS